MSTITVPRALLQQALEALEQMVAMCWSPKFTRREYDSDEPEENELRDAVSGSIADLRAALAQQETIIRGLHSISNEDHGVLTLCFADESSAEAFMVSHAGDADEALIQRAALAQQEQADYPEEKLQAVAEYVANQYHVWYGVAARDIEEVLRQSVSCGLVSNPPRREWVSLTEEEIGDVFQAARNAKLGSANDNSRHRLSVVEIARAIEQALKEKNNG